MQTLKIFSFVALFMALATMSFAQKAKTETIPVSGNCGMCKSKIEKAAKSAGVEDAKWDVDAKVLTVKYNSSTTNAAKIQQAVAAAGYDTRDVKATTEAYDKLHGCCQYDRAAAAHDDAKKECCSKTDHDGKDCCKNTDSKMPARKTGSDGDCCKDGKCSMPGHDGKDCCKASH
jgi:copper chaperone CopZ